MQKEKKYIFIILREIRFSSSFGRVKFNKKRRSKRQSKQLNLAFI